MKEHSYSASRSGGEAEEVRAADASEPCRHWKVPGLSVRGEHTPSCREGISSVTLLSMSSNEAE